jgi:hypothetical protein
MPKLTKLEWVVEAAALAGTVLGLAIIAYGGLTLPDIVPTHIGYGGVIDSHGSKWVQLSFFTVAMILNYLLLTFAGRFLGRHAAAVATDKSAQTYRIGQAITRWVKLAFAWALALLAAWYVAAMHDNPKLALGGAIVLVLILMPLLTYAANAILVPYMSESKYAGMRKMVRK